MNRLVGFIPGIAMLAVGTVKVWTHTQSLQAFLSVRCGPEGVSSAVSGPTFWTSMFAGHCWGCPVSLAGAAMILVAIAMPFRPQVTSRLRLR
jgi:hypothetical protein